MLADVTIICHTTDDETRPALMHISKYKYSSRMFLQLCVFYDFRCTGIVNIFKFVTLFISFIKRVYLISRNFLLILNFGIFRQLYTLDSILGANDLNRNTIGYFDTLKLIWFNYLLAKNRWSVFKFKKIFIGLHKYQKFDCSWT